MGNALAHLLSAATQTGAVEFLDTPYPRVHGYASVNGVGYVGGLRGMARGTPGKWQILSRSAVRQVEQVGDSIWVLYGSGAVDKIEPRLDRLTYDVLAGAAKRPWTSCLSSRGDTVYFGGLGGWAEKTPKRLVEHYPKEMDGQVVTAICAIGDTVWLGTQNGLFRVRGDSVVRFGLGAGLPDPWVTSLVEDYGQVLAGLADGGLVRVRDKVATEPCPTKKVLRLAWWPNGKVIDAEGKTYPFMSLVVGGLDGTWVRNHDRTWRQIDGREATCLTVLGRSLYLGTPQGLREIRG